MKVMFEYKGHKVELSRGVITSELLIDSSTVDVCNGFTGNQMKDFSLSGTIDSPTGEQSKIQVNVSPKMLHDEVSLFVNGSLVESKTVSPW